MGAFIGDASENQLKTAALYRVLHEDQELAEADAMTQAFHAPMLLVYFLRLLRLLPLFLLLRWPKIASTGF